MSALKIILIVPALGLLALALVGPTGSGWYVPIPLLLLGALIGMGVFIGQLWPSSSPVSRDLPDMWDEVDGGDVTIIDSHTAVVHTHHGHFMLHKNHKGTGMIEVNQEGNIVGKHWTWGTNRQLGEHIKYVVNTRKGRSRP